ncbi:MAG: PKD domain-containing protein, partial [Planctomycetota bacterium]
PLTVQFDGTGSYDPEGGPLTYHWDFGDRGFADDPTATHTYSSFGSYVARLRVIDNTNQVDVEAIFITVGPVDQSPWR